MSQKEEFTLTRRTFSSRKASTAHDSKRTSPVALDDGASLCMLQTCGSIACRSCGIEAASAVAILVAMVEVEYIIVVFNGVMSPCYNSLMADVMQCFMVMVIFKCYFSGELIALT